MDERIKGWMKSRVKYEKFRLYEVGRQDVGWGGPVLHCQNP